MEKMLLVDGEDLERYKKSIKHFFEPDIENLVGINKGVNREVIDCFSEIVDIYKKEIWDAKNLEYVLNRIDTLTPIEASICKVMHTYFHTYFVGIVDRAVAEVKELDEQESTID